ncbi:GntR family transcriptional regulator [Arthrobacter sp. alpha11c]
MTISEAPDRSPLSAAEFVQSDLRREITEGRLVPGERLVDSSLADRYGVSRNTVRDALRLLTADGLVASIRNAGSSVRSLEVEDVRDIYTARRLVEGAAVIQSARATEEQLAHLDAVANATERFIIERNWNDAGTSSLAFHQALVQLANSTRVNAFFENLVAQLRLAFAFMPDERRFQRQWSARDREIADRILSGQRDEADALLMRYLNESEAMVLDGIRQAARASQQPLALSP